MHLPHLTSPRLRALFLVLALCLTRPTQGASALQSPDAAPTPLLKEDPVDALVSESDFASVELRSDVRLFALYAAFNALGYDTAKMTNARPFPRRDFSQLRRQVRRETTLPRHLETEFLDLFQQSDVGLVSYEACALSLTDDFQLPPENAANCPEKLAQLPQLLRSFWASSLPSLAPIYPEVALQARQTLKPLFNELIAFHSSLTSFFTSPTGPKVAPPNASLSPSAMSAPAPDLVVVFNELSAEKSAHVQRGKIDVISFGNDACVPNKSRENAADIPECVPPPDVLRDVARILTQKMAEKACGKTGANPEAVDALVQEAFRLTGATPPPESVQNTSEKRVSKARKVALKNFGTLRFPDEVCHALFQR